MKEILIWLFFFVFTFLAFFYPILDYLVHYIVAKKKWFLIDAKVVNCIAYPRSYGSIPIVEYEFENKKMKIEVYHAAFSDYLIEEELEIMVNPSKPEICIVKNSNQFIKNILLFLFSICLISITFYLFVQKIVEYLN